STGNCLAGYRVLREAKLKGATVLMGGIHPTIFPAEPLEMGADAVVTGNGDLIWSRAVRDALEAVRGRSDSWRGPVEGQMGPSRPSTIHICKHSDGRWLSRKLQLLFGMGHRRPASAPAADREDHPGG